MPLQSLGLRWNFKAQSTTIKTLLSYQNYVRNEAPFQEKNAGTSSKSRRLCPIRKNYQHFSKKDAIAFCSNFSKINFKFDKILLDVPCSGEGTLRSSPKTFVMWNHKVINKLSRLQKKFMAFALKCLKKGGTLVYSTCTHAPEENETIIDFALKNFPVKIESLSLPLKTRPGISSWNSEVFHPDTKKSCRLYPQDNDSEGFFLAKLTLLEE